MKKALSGEYAKTTTIDAFQWVSIKYKFNARKSEYLNYSEKTTPLPPPIYVKDR